MQNKHWQTDSTQHLQLKSPPPKKTSTSQVINAFLNCISHVVDIIPELQENDYLGDTKVAWGLFPTITQPSVAWKQRGKSDDTISFLYQLL